MGVNLFDGITGFEWGKEDFTDSKEGAIWDEAFEDEQVWAMIMKIW